MRPDVLVDGVIQVISMSWLWSWLWFALIVGPCLNCLRRLLVNLRRCLYDVNVVVDVVVDVVVKTLGSRGGTDNLSTGASSQASSSLKTDAKWGLFQGPVRVVVVVGFIFIVIVIVDAVVVGVKRLIHYRGRRPRRIIGCVWERI